MSRAENRGRSCRTRTASRDGVPYGAMPASATGSIFHYVVARHARTSVPSVSARTFITARFGTRGRVICGRGIGGEPCGAVPSLKVRRDRIPIRSGSGLGSAGKGFRIRDATSRHVRYVGNETLRTIESRRTRVIRPGRDDVVASGSVRNPRPGEISGSIRRNISPADRYGRSGAVRSEGSGNGIREFGPLGIGRKSLRHDRGIRDSFPAGSLSEPTAERVPRPRNGRQSSKRSAGIDGLGRRSRKASSVRIEGHDVLSRRRTGTRRRRVVRARPREILGVRGYFRSRSGRTKIRRRRDDG